MKEEFGNEYLLYARYCVLSTVCGTCLESYKNLNYIIILIL